MFYIMAKIFNVNGACIPDRHYMVNLDKRLEKIKTMVDAGDYFIINRARQYGKTTLLRALAEFLKKDYYVVSMDFQRMSASKFRTENIFSVTFARDFIRLLESGNFGNTPGQSPNLKSGKSLSDEDMFAMMKLQIDTKRDELELYELFRLLTDICSNTSRPIVLIIDEVDSAANNQVFLDFLAQLRASYLDRDISPAFQSVILAGVYDIRTMKLKLRSDDEHRLNSPWNIAAKFLIDMDFSPGEIAGMLKEYENDTHTGMNIDEITGLIHNHTSGYPYLVSSLCKNIDEEIAGTEKFPDKGSAWTREGFIEAEKLLLNDNNTLFQSLTGKLIDYPQLRTMLYQLLFTGKTIPYVSQNPYIDAATMFGFIKNLNGNAVIANRIFESMLYNLFISEEFSGSKMYDAGAQDKNLFIADGHLNVRRVLEKFVETFDYLYGDEEESFLENAGRRYFMLFLKPIINGVGNCYVESETRNRERMDLVIDYRGEQSIIEMKVWRGNAYNERGEDQLCSYLDYFHLKKGYMLSFNFNKKKTVGVREIVLGDRVLIEAVV